MSRQFPLGAVLTVTTGIVLCQVDGIYEILNYLTGDDLFTHQLPRASEECRDPLLAQHPRLAEIVVPKGLNTFERVDAWLSEQAKKYGALIDLEPVAAEDHTRIDPLTELEQMTDKPIIPIVVDGER